MSKDWRARDLKLLDTLDALDRTSIDENVWRVVRKSRDPLQGHPSGARWDPGVFDVIYTSFEQDGAISEMYFHLSRQPVFPSKVRFILYEIAVTTRSTLKFADLRELEPLGVEAEKYNNILYTQTQVIGDAAHFLGFDGIIAPSARWSCLNLTIFTDQLNPVNLDVKKSELISWNKWRESKGES